MSNGSEFADTIKNRYGLEPHVLSGDDEARLTFLGATSERDPEDRTPTLVLTRASEVVYDKNFRGGFVFHI